MRDDENKGFYAENSDNVSFGGRSARRLVQLFNHLPGIGPMAQNGEIRKYLTDHEVGWLSPPYLKRELIRFDNFTMERIYNEEARHCGKRVVLQIHGGGYYGKLNNTYRDLALLYHEITGGMDVVSIDYRVAPEHPFPAALNDTIAAYRWLIKKKDDAPVNEEPAADDIDDENENVIGEAEAAEGAIENIFSEGLMNYTELAADSTAGGYDHSNIIFAGDSAGGGLALSAMLYLRDMGAPLPRGIITMSAWTDLTKRGKSYEEHFENDPIFGGSRDTLVYKDGYIKGNNPSNPYISPVNGDYKRFPPMLMQVGEYEMLLSDTLTVAAAAREAGVDITEHTYKGMFHIFQLGKMHYKESKAAWMEVAKFIHELYRRR